MLVYQNTTGDIDQKQIAEAAQENGISVMLAQMLFHRNVKTREQMRRFLNPSAEDFCDPMELPDMDLAVKRIQKAVAEGEYICIYGDYDVDGICATTLLMRCLKDMGARVEYFIPSRHKQGYGMHADVVRQLHADGVQLIVTVDNSISAVEEIALCGKLGVDVVVTDHHQCGRALPQCCAVVCTTRGDSRYPNGNLCGAGVALRLAQALGRNIDGADLAIAALATVADVVPLTGENRAIVALGMRNLGDLAGLNALIRVSGYEGKPMDSMAVGYGLAPRLNAAGRMGSASRGVELLMETDEQRACALAAELDQENRKRQTEEMRILKDACTQLERCDLSRDYAILLYGEDWNPGVIGIVASRLMEMYYRPVILFHKNGELMSGSGRSIPQIHLFDCLNRFSDRMLRFGGHAQAAGLTIREELFSDFRRDFNAYLRENVPRDALIPRRSYEMEIPLESIDTQLIRDIESLAPFGEGNPRPVFRARAVTLENMQRMGKELQHLRANIRTRENVLPVVAFGKGERMDQWMSARKLDILYSPNLNVYRGRTQLQMIANCIQAMPLTQEEIRQKAYRQKFYDAYMLSRYLSAGEEISAETAENMNLCVEQALSGDIIGTLILCATPLGAQRLLAYLNEKGVTARTDLLFSDNAANGFLYNCTVFAPNRSRLQTAQYRTILLYDGRACAYACAGIASGQTVVSADGDGGEREMLKALSPTRDAMGRLYKQFCAFLAAGPQKRAALLVQMEQWTTYEEACLALGVFLELGFFEWEMKDDVISRHVSPAQQPLETSALYRDICSAWK